jgi:glutathione S-transferase
MKLLGSLTSPYTRKVRIMLAEKRIDCELELVDVNAPDNPVLQRNPLSKIPTLVLDDGTSLFDSRVIVEFLDNASPIARLIPADKRARVTVRRWEALADGVLDAGLLVRYESLRPKKEQSAAWSERQLGKVNRGIEMLATDLGRAPRGASPSAIRSPTSRSDAPWGGLRFAFRRSIGAPVSRAWPPYRQADEAPGVRRNRSEREVG